MEEMVVGLLPQVQGEESLACCHFWPEGCGVVRADAKEPRKKEGDRERERERERERGRVG